MTLRHFAMAALFGFTLASCKKDKTVEPTPYEPKLIFKFKFDSTQQRLNNVGQPSDVPAGHGAQSPKFNGMSAHYIELAPGAFTALGGGVVVYKAAETTAGGDNAIDFSKATVAQNGQAFFSIPIKNVTPGSYEWLRVSLAYQNYDIKYKSTLLPSPHIGTGTVASFIGFNTYIKNFTPKTQDVNVNANRLQGYWAFETFGTVVQGQAPAGATTVPNPLFNSSPIPAGSCVVTGAFDEPLQITGNESGDVVVTVSVSTNKSFEWSDTAGDNVYEPMAGDQVVDMGVRGMIPTVQY